MRDEAEEQAQRVTSVVFVLQCARQQRYKAAEGAEIQRSPRGAEQLNRGHGRIERCGGTRGMDDERRREIEIDRERRLFQRLREPHVIDRFDGLERRNGDITCLAVRVSHDVARDVCDEHRVHERGRFGAASFVTTRKLREQLENVALKHGVDIARVSHVVCDKWNDASGDDVRNGGRKRFQRICQPNAGLRYLLQGRRGRRDRTNERRDVLAEHPHVALDGSEVDQHLERAQVVVALSVLARQSADQHGRQRCEQAGKILVPAALHVEHLGSGQAGAERLGIILGQRNEIRHENAKPLRVDEGAAGGVRNELQRRGRVRFGVGVGVAVQMARDVLD
mmetsp:Transcript_23092/g.71640  ORF Transcript_23092/g.71640 Transcript_23092/m.71640 type:complete len:337 (+) Transcript_23092:1072-2082(+)